MLCVIVIALGIGSQQIASAQGKSKQTTTDVIKSDTATRPQWCYFPSANTTDGRFMSLIGQHMQSMAGDFIEFGIGLPESADSLRIGFFDGETSGLWDFGTTSLDYTVYSDSSCDGTGSTQLGTWNGSTMPDNGWFQVTLAKPASAKTSDTVYFFRVVIRLTDTTTKVWSNFKFRTNGKAALLPRAFAFAAPLFTTSDAQIIYPNYPLTNTTTYDGSWKFCMTIPYPVEDLELWDGDMDYGNYSGTVKDTDDVDTPNEVPDWCSSTVPRAEGVATSNDFIYNPDLTRSLTTVMTGQPADDNYNTWYRRAPSVTYTVVDPDSIVYENLNPSGNLEWERFRISTILTSASHYDYYASTLPRGTYTVNLSGMDLGNMNAWRAWFSLLGSSDSSDLADGRDTEGPSSTNFRFIPVFSGVDSTGACMSILVPSISGIGGTGSWGWWHRHSDDWPVEVITAGGVTYSKDDAIELLQSAGSDLRIRVARELIAAKLNVFSGSESDCITAWITAGDAWLVLYPVGGGGTTNTTTGDPIFDALKSYNQGQGDCANGNNLN